MDLHAVDCDYAHRLATMLECALLNRLGSWDEGHALLDEYRAACRAVMPDAPTFMGEPVIHAAELVEIDGHTYALRPGAARVVREALSYRNALAWIATVAATEREYQDLAIRVLREPDLMKLIPWRNAHIDAAMAKDGA